MGARRSDRRRTAIALPRGSRRPRSASTLLLSFALLAALSTPMGARGLANRGPGALGAPTSTKGVSNSAAAGAASAAANSAGARTIATVSHQPKLLPPLRPPRMRPARIAAVLNPDANSPASPLGLSSDPPDFGTTVLTSDRVEAGATATFLGYVSKSSRTRGQPVSDC